LTTLPGIIAVSVDIPTTNVRVTFDSAQTSRDAIVARLDDEGYPVSP